MRRLSKKIMGTVLVAALTASMSFSVFAKESPETVAPVEVGGAQINGKDVEVNTKPLTEAQKEETKKIIADKNATPEEKKAAQEKLQEVLDKHNVKVNNIEDCEVVSVSDIEVPDLKPGESVTLTFNVPKLTPDKQVIVLHFNEGTGEWEVIPCEVREDGTVAATFTSLSPVMIVLAPKYTEGGNANVNTNTNTNVNANTGSSTKTGTSPATGESSVVTLAAMIAAVAAAGAFAFRKKTVVK